MFTLSKTPSWIAPWSRNFLMSLLRRAVSRERDKPRAHRERINGIAVGALIDSGAVCRCTISEELASQLHLQRLNGVEFTTQGVSGDLLHGWIASGSINLVIKNITMTVDRPNVVANKNLNAFPPVTIGYAGMKSMHLAFDYDHKTLVISK